MGQLAGKGETAVAKQRMWENSTEPTWDLACALLSYCLSYRCCLQARALCECPRKSTIKGRASSSNQDRQILQDSGHLTFKRQLSANALGHYKQLRA